MRRLDRIVRDSGFDGPLAYWHPNWSRKNAPLLDYLGANVDHVEAHSKGGVHGPENFVTACNKCNMRKNDSNAADFGKRLPLHKVRGKYGEPTDWDGFSALFIVLVERDQAAANSSELPWLRALTVAKTAPVVEAAPTASVPKPKPVAKAKVTVQGIGLKADKKTAWQKVYSSLQAMQNGAKNYNWTLQQYREISAEGLAGEWIDTRQIHREA
jgi:hypothetical protein